MRMAAALELIKPRPVPIGYMVHFERIRGGCLESDCFPDRHAGELLIQTEEEAWALASQFAAVTRGQCCNFYVIGADFVPVPGYEARRIANR